MYMQFLLFLGGRGGIQILTEPMLKIYKVKGFVKSPDIFKFSDFWLLLDVANFFLKYLLLGFNL